MGYLIAAVVFVPLALFFYMRSVGSRKKYICSNCGEEIVVELMTAKHCNVCGTPFKGES